MLFKLENFLPYRLRILYDTITHSFSPLYIEQYGLAPSEWRILASIADNGLVTAKALSIHSRMHKTKVSRAVCALARRDLIDKIPNEDDLRETFLKVSPKGAKIYAELSILASKFDDNMLKCLSDDEQKTLFELVERLQKHAETNFDK